MKHVLLVLLVLLSNDPREVARANALKKEAAKAFFNKDYKAAVNALAQLDSMNQLSPEAKLNLGHAFYLLRDTTNAQLHYQGLTSQTGKLKSVAHQQLGVMQREANKLEESLQSLREALKADPSNEQARYNYELVKKLVQKQKEEQQQQQNQQNQDKQKQQQNDQSKDQQQQQDQKQEGQENKDKKDEQGKKDEGEKKDGEEKQEEKQPGEDDESEQKKREEALRQKLKEMNISEEKAKMILEALRQNEVQYIQQQKRKPTERPQTGKPDW
jgi:Ca-activated chloride channel homolog